MPRHRRRVSGTTLVELLIVLALLVILVTVLVPPIVRLRDAVAVRSAALELEQTIGLARERAAGWRRAVAVRLDARSGRVVVAQGDRTLLVRELGEEYGARLAATRDSLAFDARGLGLGAANLTVVLRRGAAAESVVVSRLGRVRR